ncbi:MAG: ParB/RepB/Spo0J family partition protein [Phycisphaerae bacterium]
MVTDQRAGSTPGAASPTQRHGSRSIAVSAIAPNPFQPRNRPEQGQLAELAESIRRNGLLQPVVVRQRGASFELVIGHRRWQAAQQAGLAEIPAVVRQASDEQMIELALIENIHREDLNPIDRANAYWQYKQRFGLTAEQIAERVGEDRSTVANYLRLLELPEHVKSLLADGSLGMGQARALLGLAEPSQQIGWATRIIRQGLSVRQVERLVQQHKAGRAEKKKRPLIREIEDRFAAALGTPVQILEGRKRNSGRIVIHYRSLEDFDRIVQRLGVELAEE